MLPSYRLHLKMPHSQRFAPRASRKTRLLLAALVWSSVGLCLLGVGLHWLVARAPRLWLLAIPIALLGGWGKGHFVLRSQADENVQRILESPDSHCVGGTFSWASWGIALSMILMGAILRHSELPRTWLGVIYAIAGTALLTASMASWRAWRRL